MVNKIKASFICLVFLQMCLTGGIARDLGHAITSIRAADSPAQTATSPDSCLREIDQLTERLYREARESNREVDTKDLQTRRADAVNKCVAVFSVNSVAIEHLSALAKLYFEAKRFPQADKEELKTIRKFYVDELKMPFPILIEGPLKTSESRDEEKASRQWRLFSFYPMMLVIDKKGRTRAILIGALPGQGERMRTKVEELLKEPA